MTHGARTSGATPRSLPAVALGSDASHAAADGDGTTRERVLSLIVTDGPVSAASLATDLGLTPAGVRRHLAQLETDGLISVHDSGATTGMRGRPARHYVATNRGQSELSGAYPDLATQALRFLRDVAGEDAVEDFARRRLEELTDRYAPRITADDGPRRAARRGPRRGRVRRERAPRRRDRDRPALPGALPGPARRRGVPPAVRRRGPGLLPAPRLARPAARDPRGRRARVHHQRPRAPRGDPRTRGERRRRARDHRTTRHRARTARPGAPPSTTHRTDRFIDHRPTAPLRRRRNVEGMT